MPNIHIPTLLFVLGAGALVVAVVGMMLNEKESKKRAAARRNRATKNTRILETRTPTNVGRAQESSRTTPPAGQAPQTFSTKPVPRTEGAGSPPVPENTPEPLHSDSPVLDEAQRLAELMAEDAPERIVAILREWMREDQ